MIFLTKKLQILLMLFMRIIQYITNISTKYVEIKIKDLQLKTEAKTSVRQIVKPSKFLIT